MKTPQKAPPPPPVDAVVYRYAYHYYCAESLGKDGRRVMDGIVNLHTKVQDGDTFTELRKFLAKEMGIKNADTLIIESLSYLGEVSVPQPDKTL